MGTIVKRGTKQKPRFYFLFVDADGKRKQRAAKGAQTVEQARQIMRAAELRVSQGKVGIVEATADDKRRRTITLAKLAERFVDEYAPPRIKSVDEYRRQTRAGLIGRLLPLLGADRAAASITSVDVERARDALLADEYAGASVSWSLARLSKMYVWGRKVGILDCSSPVAGVEHPKRRREIDYLSREEVARLLERAEKEAPDVQPMIAAAVYAGLRKGELYGLRWRDVNLDAGRLDVMRSYTSTPKSGEPRHVPINPELARILRSWRDRCPSTGEGLVFPVWNVCDGWVMGDRLDMRGLAGLFKAAECHAIKKPWHALRHTFASHFMMAGGNILTLQKLLGHAELSNTLIYAHLAPDFMVAEVARMSFAMPTASVASLDEARRQKAGAYTPRTQAGEVKP